MKQKTKRNSRLMIMIILILVLLALHITPLAFAGDPPGSFADPVITKSYLEKYLNLFFNEKVEQIRDIERQLKEVDATIQYLREVAVPPFPDMENHWARQDVIKLYRLGIVGGYDDDGNFKPNETVTRAQLAVMLVRAKDLPRVDVTTVPNPFRDLDQDYLVYQDILTAREAGMIGGYPDGTFKPNVEISRAEMATIIDRTFLLGEERQSIDFQDVASSYWAIDHIDSLVKAGIISGYEDKTFRPENNVNRAEAVTFISRAMKFSF